MDEAHGGKKLVLTSVINLKEITITIRKMEKVYLHGKVEIYTKEII